MDKDALVMPQGPITRSRSKAIKDKLNLFMGAYINKEMSFEDAKDERGYTEKPMVHLLQAN